MTRFLGNWEVESDIILPEGVPFLRYDASAYTVFLRNVPGNRNDLTYLSMQVIFDAPDLTQAKTVGQQVAKEFLDYLSLVSNLKVRLRKLFQIFNWEQEVSPGIRECLYFSPHSNYDDAPYHALDPKLLEFIALLQKQELDPRLRRAMKWFGNGIASRFPDDQFVFFWFVVELVAQVIKNTSPVPDRCPKCKGPLHCTECGMTPLHRPYPKHAIEQLFTKYGAVELYRRASDARNMLMHGDEIASIEAALNIDFGDLVDDMGKLSWASLINQFIPVLIGTQPTFLRSNQYVYKTLSGSAHMHIGLVPNFENPDPAHFPEVKFEMISSPRSVPAKGPNHTGRSDS